MSEPLRWYLRVLAALTLISGLGQLALPAKLGAASAWGTALGWQREIGFWGVAMYILITRTLRTDNPMAGRSVAIALVTLQFFVAANHIVATIQSHALLNGIMGAVNCGCALFGAWVLRVKPTLSVRT